MDHPQVVKSHHRPTPPKPPRPLGAAPNYRFRTDSIHLRNQPNPPKKLPVLLYCPQNQSTSSRRTEYVLFLSLFLRSLQSIDENRTLSARGARCIM
ncbi:hypothetical protein Mapa_013017 [Marchantia paleacea]|nr:hypothetical protein Mapa_013017 [Marchantia paleacea]